MKIKLFLTAVTAALVIGTAQVTAATIVTAPIDSRPISCDYLEDLADLSGDKVLYPNKADMDFFSGNAAIKDRFADSEKVRRQIYELTGENNVDGNSVIINTSTYFTAGLVGSRVGSNYSDIDKGLADLRKLAEDYSKPYYYVNLTTPRALPETRFNSVWRDDEVIYGIGHYYLKHNPDCEDRAYIKTTFEKVTPVQLIMEYSYVSGKLSEGVPLSDWERDFYRAVNTNYMSKDPYRTYLNNYIQPFAKSVRLMEGLIQLKKEGLIDEIVISTDDLQLPNSIKYFAQNGAGWVQKLGGSTVKYSFARSKFSTDADSITRQIDAYEGKQECGLSMTGNGRDINVIYGMDEVPQLIYAREVSRRKAKGSAFNIIYNSTSKNVGTFDVTNVQKLTKAAVDFVNGKRGAGSGCTDLYIYSYGKKVSAKDTANKMRSSLKNGNRLALIELYDSATLNNSNNEMFKTLLDGRIVRLTDLCAYSAWNTNGNAIGLGVAHAQVYALNVGDTNRTRAFAQAQVKQLARHAVEDGVYTVQTKRLLSNEGYKPPLDELEESAKLREYLNEEPILAAFKNSNVKAGGKTYTVKSVSLDKCGFPWARTFDCILDIGCELK